MRDNRQLFAIIIYLSIQTCLTEHTHHSLWFLPAYQTLSFTQPHQCAARSSCIAERFCCCFHIWLSFWACATQIRLSLFALQASINTSNRISTSQESWQKYLMRLSPPNLRLFHTALLCFHQIHKFLFSAVDSKLGIDSNVQTEQRNASDGTRTLILSLFEYKPRNSVIFTGSSSHLRLAIESRDEMNANLSRWRLTSAIQSCAYHVPPRCMRLCPTSMLGVNNKITVG